MLWGIRNAFYGLGFGSKPSESSAKQPDAEPEQEVQQQPANDTSQSFDSAMPWSTWKQVVLGTTVCEPSQHLLYEHGTHIYEHDTFITGSKSDLDVYAFMLE